MGKTIQIGFATADITPKLPVALLGQYERRVATEVLHPLKSVVMAIDAEGEAPVIWAACDLLYCPKSLTVETAKLLADIPGFTEDCLIMSATHIHTGPYLHRWHESALIRYPNLDGELTQPEENLAFTAKAIADAVRKAWEARVPSSVQCAVSPIQTGYCRRVTYMDGSSVMYGDVSREDFKCLEYHDGGNVNILYVRDGEGKLTGIVANVPCTAQVVEHKEYVTSDYWGYTRDYINEALGVPVLGITASAGDLSPRDLLQTMPEEPSNNDEEGAKDLGERIAKALVKQIPNTRELDTEFKHLYRSAWLPRWNPTLAEYKQASDYMKALIEKEGESVLDEPFIGHPINYFEYSEAEVRIQRFKDDLEYVSAPIHVVRLGDICFVTNPFECYIEYADRLRAACPGTQIFDVQLTGDAMGYLATRRAIRGGGYSAMIFNGQCAPEGGDTLVRESLAMIRDTGRETVC